MHRILSFILGRHPRRVKIGQIIPPSLPCFQSRWWKRAERSTIWEPQTLPVIAQDCDIASGEAILAVVPEAKMCLPLLESSSTAIMEGY